MSVLNQYRQGVADHSLAVAQRLPAERSSFVGRRDELGKVRDLLSASRLVCLVGPGGVGKTRLAARAATHYGRSFRDGAALVELAGIRNQSLVARQVAEAFDMRDDSGRWLAASVASVLSDRHVLLVLDNCEHLRDACAVLVDTLLASCPRLHVLATSRQPLEVPGESILTVPPLPTPEVGSQQNPCSFDAVKLLVERAEAAGAPVDASPGENGELAELCRRLDGVPLAIELAAVRLRTLSAAEVIARLEDRFRLLSRTGATAVPERHRSLRATLEWSFDLLDETQQLLWARVAVFAAEFDAAAAESVCADGALPRQEVLDALTGLVDASVVDVVRGGTPTFRMLETVRVFGAELLEKSGDSHATRVRHREWCGQLAASAAAKYLGPEQVAAFDKLSAHHAELSGALHFCTHTAGQADAGLSIACDMWLYWEARGHLGEGRRALEDLLNASSPESADRARGLVVAGFLALGATDFTMAVPLLEQGLEIAEARGQGFVAALATQYLGQAALFSGDLPMAERLLRAAARRHAEHDARHSAFCMADIGVVALIGGRLEAATQAFQECLAGSEGADPWTRSHALWGLGLVRLQEGNPAEAVVLEQDALRLIREVDDRSGIALCVEALAWASAAQADWDRAARLLGASDATWRSIPAQLPPPMAAFRNECTAQVRRALGQRRWVAGYQEGLDLTRQQAVSAAVGETTAPSGSQQKTTAGPELTKRQREVAALVAQGMTDREIAASLVISPRTAESHIEQILTRLGFRSRTQIAAWQAEQHGH